MRRFAGREAVVTLGLVVLAVSAACGAEPPPPVRVSHPATLVGTTWTLVSIGGRSVPAGPDITLEFGPDQVSGNGGCNSFGGSYRYDPGTGALAIGDLVSTKRACVEPARNDVEAAYLQGLRVAKDASMDPAGWLVLSGPGSELALTVGPRQAGVPIFAPRTAPS